MKLNRWQSLMQKFEFSLNVDTFNKLVKAYDEPHRRYHTAAHINACLAHLDDVKNQATHSEEIEMALWFHDAIYKPFSKTNEKDSAEWCRQFLLHNNAQSDAIDRIVTMIEITETHNASSATDQNLMLDIDLSILGTRTEVYDQFEKDVRFEYKLVPWFIFKNNRKKILQNFLSRERIFQHDYFHQKLEQQEHLNLNRVVASL